MKTFKQYFNEKAMVKKGDKVKWTAPDGTKMSGKVISGEIKGKIKVMPDKKNSPEGRVEVLVKVEDLMEAEVTTAEHIDLANPGNRSMQVSGEFKPNIPSKKTVKKYDEVFIAAWAGWGIVEEIGPKTVKVNTNPGMGNRPKIQKYPYDQIVVWKYKREYAWVNQNRMLKD